MWVSKREYEKWEKERKYLEGEVDYYRRLSDAERKRADRLHDQLLQDHGVGPASETSIIAQERAEKEVREVRKTYQDELYEIYGEAIAEHADTVTENSESELVDAIGEEVAAAFGRGKVTG